MDGVLLDTESIGLRSWQEAAVPYGMDAADVLYKECIGSDGAHAERVLHQNLGAEFPVQKFFRENHVINKRIRDTEGIPLKPGVREILKFISDTGLPLALASSTHKVSVEHELSQQGIYDYFEVVQCGDMVTKTKPDPEIYLNTMALLNVDPAECLVIEDSYNGVRAAHAAGARVFMVPDLLPATDEMRLKTERICNDLHEVREILKEMML